MNQNDGSGERNDDLFTLTLCWYSWHVAEQLQEKYQFYLHSVEKKTEYVEPIVEGFFYSDPFTCCMRKLKCDSTYT